MAFEQQLDVYGDLAVSVALNLQPGQRLLIIGPLMNGGVALEAAPIVRRIAAAAYRAGAQLVEAIWGDEALQLARFHHARTETLGEFSAWLPRALEEHAKAGHAVLSVYANDPDLLRHEPPDLVGALQQATSRAVMPFREHVSRNATNWGVVAAASEAWAAKVFPELPRGEQLPRLWETIARFCRLDRPDPIEAWKAHLAALAARSHTLNRKRYAALRFRAPGTDLTVGLPAGHIWVSGESVTQSGIKFVANLPTEEVFTIADRGRVEGTVRATKPLSYAGTLIEDFSLRFAEGRVVDVKAARGEAVLRQLVDTDPTSGRSARRWSRTDRRSRSRAAVLQHALRRERGQPCRARLRVQVHADRGRHDERRRIRAGGWESQRRPRRLHDRVGRHGRRRRGRRRVGRAADARRRVGELVDTHH